MQKLHRAAVTLTQLDKKKPVPQGAAAKSHRSLQSRGMVGRYKDLLKVVASSQVWDVLQEASVLI